MGAAGKDLAMIVDVDDKGSPSGNAFLSLCAFLNLVSTDLMRSQTSATPDFLDQTILVSPVISRRAVKEEIWKNSSISGNESVVFFWWRE